MDTVIAGIEFHVEFSLAYRTQNTICELSSERCHVAFYGMAMLHAGDEYDQARGEKLALRRAVQAATGSMLLGRFTQKDVIRIVREVLHQYRREHFEQRMADALRYLVSRAQQYQADADENRRDELMRMCKGREIETLWISPVCEKEGQFLKSYAVLDDGSLRRWTFAGKTFPRRKGFGDCIMVGSGVPFLPSETDLFTDEERERADNLALVAGKKMRKLYTGRSDLYFDIPCILEDGTKTVFHIGYPGHDMTFVGNGASLEDLEYEMDADEEWVAPK